MRVLLVSLLAFKYVMIILGSTQDYKDNMCLNGVIEPAGNCNCRDGFSLFNGNCFLKFTPKDYRFPQLPETPKQCGAGFININANCIPLGCSGSSCGVSCPPGFILKSGFCVFPEHKCPAGMVLRDGFCHYYPFPPTAATMPPIQKVVETPPLRIELPLPELIEPLDPNKDPMTESVEVVPNLRPPIHQFPAKKNVHNVNTINSPTDVNTYNVNNVFVHINRTRNNGIIKAVIIRNNETTVYEEPPKEKSTEDCGETEDEESTEPSAEQPKKCCIVVSPRICRKQEEDEWVCFHRKHYRCGSFCTSDIVYLRPRKPSMHKSLLVMPPTYGYSPFMRFGVCRWGVCPPIDCSGCLNGKYRCHYKCYTYDCAQDRNCNFVNQEEFCNEMDDDICKADSL